MSTPQPPRRRRIAGETKPGTPAPKTSVVKKAAKVRTPSKAPAPPKTPPPPKPPKPSKTSATEAPSRPDAPESPGAEAKTRTRRFRAPAMSGRFGALIALTVAALVFGAVFGVRGFDNWRDDHGIVAAHEKAATTAAASAETIFTYQYNKLGEHLSASKKTMTPAFAKKFESIAPALQDLAPQRKIQVKATVRNAAAIECGNTCRQDAATILVFLDQARVADGAKKPTVFGNRIELKMVERNGEWLVNEIKAL